MNSKYRYLIPNGITFLSLTCGLVAIMLAASGNLAPAGWLILTSYVLDLFDGATARRLQASSEFGLQLDSLVDMVSLGTAPAVLCFVHLQRSGVAMGWVWPFVILLALAGAFRLARFNLLPPKTSGSKDSVGLPISTGGAAAALAVLADLTYRSEFFPDWTFIPYLLLMSLLMVSTIPFPSFMWIIAEKRRNIVLLLLVAISFVVFRFQLAIVWFFWTNVFLLVAVMRAGYQRRVGVTT